MLNQHFVQIETTQKMRRIFLIILVLNHLVACSQVKENKTYYENGTLKEHNYLDENGEVTGEWKVYYRSGKLLRTGYIKNGKDEGEVKQYHENEKLMFVINYKNGVQDGEFKNYSDGKLETVDVYVNGERKKRKEFHKNGNLSAEGSYKDEKEDGEWKFYNENGKLVYFGNYKNGEKIGEMERILF